MGQDQQVVLSPTRELAMQLSRRIPNALAKALRHKFGVRRLPSKNKPVALKKKNALQSSLEPVVF
jgi:superfamily II DNA/RNA helicase